MKPQELRLGNTINSKELDINNGKEIIKPVTVDIYAMHEMINGNRCEKYSPIPLTEEWLIRFGYKKRQSEFNGGEWIRDDDSYCLAYRKEYEGILPHEPAGWYLFNDHESAHSCYMFHYIPIQYVHQLQNLYFALTGSELTINS